MQFLGTIPQWVTALIAGGALFAAYKSIESQRELARKRAAMDFFVKIEMDRDALAAHDKFTKAIERLEAHLAQGKTCEEFSSTEEYWDIRAYLNWQELMGVGINQRVFDDNVCFEFWSGELDRVYEKTQELIEYIQGRSDEPGTYSELVSVSKRWAKRWKS
jgi:hypothetical protein